VESIMTTYETELINSSSRPVTVWDAAGPPLFAILPGHKRTLESISPHTLYSRYSHVEWAPGGSVILTPRQGFEPPQIPAGHLTLVLSNIDGRDVETRMLEGIGDVHIPRGIPIFVDCPLDSPLAAYKELRITVASEWLGSRTFPGYAFENERLRDMWIERDKPDLEEQKRSPVIISDERWCGRGRNARLSRRPSQRPVPALRHPCTEDSKCE
jgi:hypothetical protein